MRAFLQFDLMGHGSCSRRMQTKRDRYLPGACTLQRTSLADCQPNNHAQRVCLELVVGSYLYWAGSNQEQPRAICCDLGMNDESYGFISHLAQASTHSLTTLLPYYLISVEDHAHSWCILMSALKPLSCQNTSNSKLNSRLIAIYMRTFMFLKKKSTTNSSL